MTYSSEVLADSPLLYLRLGEAAGATTAADASGNGHAGTYTSGKVSDTGLLTGDSDTAAKTFGTNVPAAAWMDVTSASIEVWIKPSVGTDTNKGIIGRFTAGSSASFLIWRNTVGTGQLAARFYNSAGSSVDLAWTTVAPVSGSIYHIVATYTSGDARLYINGSQVASSTALTGNLRASSPTEPMTVGYYNGNPSNGLAGTWDEPAYYDHVLTSTRVAAHYNAGTASNPTGTLSVTLPKPTEALSGSYRESGTFTATMPRVTVALSGNYIARETSTLSATMPKLTVSLSGTYTIPPTPSGTFDAVLPFPTVALSGAYHAHETGSFVVTLPPLTATLAGGYADPPHPTATAFDFRMPVPVVALSGTYTGPIPTDLSNALDGLDLLLTATVTFVVPVVAPPAALAPAQRYDKAVAYPVPVMVDGRPT